MKKLFVGLVSLFSVASIAASNEVPIDYVKSNKHEECVDPIHAMDFAKCYFVRLLDTHENAELEKIRKELVKQGFDQGNSSEYPLAVFVRGVWAKDYFTFTYLVTTDVSKHSADSTSVIKSFGAIFTGKTYYGGQDKPSTVRFEKAVPGDLFD